MKKNELEVAVEEHLRSNSSKYEKDPATALFYQGVDPASPVKHKGGKAIAGGMKEEEKKPRARRQTIKARDEVEGGFVYLLLPSTYPHGLPLTTRLSPPRTPNP